MSVNPLQPKIRGLTYPLTIANGGLATSDDFDLVRQHVLSVVETRWYERVMRADYGTEDFIFEVLKPALINSQFQASIERDVTEVEAVTVNGDWTTADSGLYRIIITYYVSGVLQPPLSFTLSI